MIARVFAVVETNRVDVYMPSLRLIRMTFIKYNYIRSYYTVKTIYRIFIHMNGFLIHISLQKVTIQLVYFFYTVFYIIAKK
jgi:hypothetical protein